MTDRKELKNEDMDQVNGGFNLPLQNLLFKSGDNKKASILETENIQKNAAKLGRAVTMPVGAMPLSSSATPVTAVPADLDDEKPTVC